MLMHMSLTIIKYNIIIIIVTDLVVTDRREATLGTSKGMFNGELSSTGAMLRKHGRIPSISSVGSNALRNIITFVVTK